MHWSPADRPSESLPEPTDAAGGEPVAGSVPPDDVSPVDGATGHGAYEPSPTFASTFAAYDAADESPWANRIVWTAAAAAVVCGGVWFTGLWEVRLDDPPAGALAERTDDGELGEALGEEWHDHDWPENETHDSDAELAALWGEEPEPSAEEGGPEPTAAFALMADSPAGEALDEVSLTPPKTAPAPPPADPLVSADDLWSDPSPAPAPSMPEPHRNADEPAGGLFASTGSPTPVAPAPAAPPVEPATPEPKTADASKAEPVRSASLETAPAASAAKAPAADPFGDDAAALPSPTAAAARQPKPATPAPAAMEDPFAGAVTPASASAATSAAPKVTTADVADAAPETPAVPATDADLLAAIDAAVEAGEVLQAHTELSRLWWDDPANRSAIRGRLDGTARQIYFDASSHFMTPRTVAAGETLADLAADLSVPEMYLARVNRVAPAAVAAGDELKVIRGPFGAALDLSGAGAGTLTMHAHGYYVRAFHAQIADVKPGEYSVGAKVRDARGVRMLLTGPDGQMLVLMSGKAPEGRAALTLRSADADQVFDLLETNGVISVRP